MARDRQKPREGPGIREFLRYYVLVLLRKRNMSDEGMRRAIKRQSRENRNFRPSGPLLVGTRDLRLVLGQLRRRGLIGQSGNRWHLTADGQDRLSGYEKQKEAELNGRERAASRLLKLMGTPRPGDTVLDVGTGDGFLAFKLADEGYRVLGIDSGSFDYSKDSIRSAVEKAASRDGKVEFRKVSVAELTKTGESFSYVVTSQAMHCMKDQGQCLDAICRLLKPGGAFLCMDFLVGLEGFLHHGWHSFLAISRDEWKKFLSHCGFEDPTCHKSRDYLVVRALRPFSTGELPDRYAGSWRYIGKRAHVTGERLRIEEQWL
jgi:ubiquinone/menaquinone biosynthesis C-methylase UbiE